MYFFFPLLFSKFPITLQTRWLPVASLSVRPHPLPSSPSPYFLLKHRVNVSITFWFYVITLFKSPCGFIKIQRWHLQQLVTFHFSTSVWKKRWYVWILQGEKSYPESEWEKSLGRDNLLFLPPQISLSFFFFHEWLPSSPEILLPITQPKWRKEGGLKTIWGGGIL